jgi:hypothetical protein
MGNFRKKAIDQEYIFAYKLYKKELKGFFSKMVAPFLNILIPNLNGAFIFVKLRF